VSNGVVGEYKCPRCGWVHVALTKEHAQATCDNWMSLQCCFNCKRPAVGFLPAGPDDAPDGCTLQPVVLWHPQAPSDEVDEELRLRAQLQETARNLHGGMPEIALASAIATLERSAQHE
jgi:hypothetical protein